MNDAGRTERALPAVLALLSVAALALRALVLASAPLLPDDAGAIASAIDFVERGQVGATMWQHPHLRDLLVYAGILVAGPGKAGAALPSIILGALAIPVTALLAWRAAGATAAVVAGFLLAIDPLHLGYSHQAVQEVQTTLFGALGLFLAVEYDRRGSARWIAAAGLAFGIGAAAKWSVAFVAIGATAWLAVREWRRAAGRAELAARWALLAAALLLLAAAAYVATWLPWLLGGRDLSDLARLHVAMAREAATHGGYNAADALQPHRAWRWFLVPTGYASFSAEGGRPVPFLFAANLATWLLVLPAFALAMRAVRRGAPAARGAVAVAFASAYLPFLAASRPIWLHSALAALPFALVLVAASAVELAERTRRPARLLGAWLAVVAALALPLGLLAAGRGWSSPLLRPLLERYRPPVEFEGRPPP